MYNVIELYGLFFLQNSVMIMKINFYNKKATYVSSGYLMVFNKNFNWYRLKKKISSMYVSLFHHQYQYL